MHSWNFLPIQFTTIYTASYILRAGVLFSLIKNLLEVYCISNALFQLSGKIRTESGKPREVVIKASSICGATRKIPNVLSCCHTKRRTAVWYDTDFSKKKKKKNIFFSYLGRFEQRVVNQERS